MLVARSGPQIAIEVLHSFGSQWENARFSSLTHHVELSMLKANVIQPKLRHFFKSRTRIQKQSDDRHVASVFESRAGERLDKRG